MIPYGRQSISEDDIARAADALSGDWLTTGPMVAEFEEQFAARLGAKHAIAVANGTAALHLAMLAAEIGPGQRVITTPNTFLASANAAAFVGATPDFVDIDPVSLCLDPAVLAEQWQPDTRAVVAVDYAGQTADMPGIAEVAHRHGALIIEDACHAIGGRFEHDGQTWPVGNHPWADMTTYSFHPVKTMTTGEGGMIVTSDDVLASRLRLLRNHGMTRNPDDFTGLGSDGTLAEQGPWYYEMQALGYNYRITDVQCALGLSQLQRLDAFIARRQEIVARYNEAFADVPHLQTPAPRNPADAALTSWHLYTVRIDFAALQTTRTEFMTKLRERGVGSQVLYIPVHLQPWYRETYGYGPGKCPTAEATYPQLLSLPLFPAMTEGDVSTVITEVRRLMEGT